MYLQILNAIGANMQDFVGGMGTMTLISSKPTETKYEMEHLDGSNTYDFPVIFVKDGNGNWKIKSF